MPNPEHTDDIESEEQDKKKPSGTTLTLEEWFEELDKCDRLHQYAKRRRERREEETDDESIHLRFTSLSKRRTAALTHLLES